MIAPLFSGDSQCETRSRRPLGPHSNQRGTKRHAHKVQAPSSYILHYDSQGYCETFGLALMQPDGSHQMGRTQILRMGTDVVA